MTAYFLVRVERARRNAGAAGIGSLWLRTVVDVLRTGLAERRASLTGDFTRRGGGMMSLGQDLRYALRMLGRSPGFTAVAVLTLALGVGATTTIFGAVNAVLLRDLPFDEPHRLMAIALTENVSISKAQLAFLQERQRSFDALAGYSAWSVTLTGDGEPAALEGARVTGNFFELLGAPVQLGRAFTPADGAAGAAPVAVISHALWSGRFAGDRGVLGRSVMLSGVPHTVVGVMRQDFQFPTPATAAWLPAVMDPADGDDYSAGYLSLIGRLSPATSQDAAVTEMRQLATALRAESGLRRLPEITPVVLPLGLGVALAWWGTRWLAAALPVELHGAAETQVDAAVLAFALLLTLACGLLFGMAPALTSTGKSHGRTLREAQRGSTAGGRRTLLASLVVSEIALAVILVGSATLMVHSFWKLRTEETGYRTAGVVTLRVSPAGSQVTGPEAVSMYWRTVLERVRAVAGVDAAGAVHILPMSGSNWNPSLAVRGQTPDTEPREVYWRIATPGYFQAVGIPLIRGRYVDERDVASAEPVAVINETLANVVFPGEDPVGREIRTGFEADGTWARVVGVVGDTRDMALDQTIMPQMYRPHEQWPIASLTLMVHSDGDAMQLLPALRRAIWSVHDQVPISETQAFDDVVASSATQPRLLAAILGSLSGLAIVLGAIGVYGVLAYTVEQRRREFGIRMALGATRSQVLRLVFVAAIRLAAVGIAFGALGALATSQLLTAHLYQTSPLDPRALLIAIAALSTAAAIAAWIPARRATRVSPGECMAAD